MPSVGQGIEEKEEGVHDQSSEHADPVDVKLIVNVLFAVSFF